ncbi:MULTISPECIES: LysR family transcriptional regulator [Vibrio]|uniref:LysR family transcriptional regulator n=2 Tax=Vibrio TaxID=662 RepID=A0A7X4LN59_9VIBR|nr:MULTISPECIES: LysR family transcriptional regulator [Vibrio]MBF9000912.1 LysR family transcriptional regulator [Vibrio nitrifigilis]MZI94865.1 LysR family transcriptional regulator [Vibrio eleionomae]
MALIHHLTAPSLRYFLAVAKFGSISEASTHLNVASSAISRQISGLEEQLNTPLFERRSRGMTLSAAGELLAAYARKVSLETNRVMGEIDALEGLEKGKVIIASTEGFSMEFLPFCIKEYQEKFPGIHFQVDVYSPKDISKAIQNGEADIGLAFSLTPVPNIRVIHSQPAPIRALIPNNHPLANKKRVSLRQICAYPLALPYADTTIRQLFDICASQQGLEYEPAFTSNYMAALNQYTVSGAGISLAGEISVRLMSQHHKLKVIPISDKGMGIRNLEVQVLAGRTLPKAVSSFSDFVIEQVRQSNSAIPEHD